MNIYSHAILANLLLSRINPKNPGEYLWGAVAPDIRYLAGIRRGATHLPDVEIAGWIVRYPGCASFIQGYRVHCLLDSIETVAVVGGSFPFNLLRLARRKPFTSQQMAVVVELYYISTFAVT